MYHEDIFYPFLPMFSTFDGKMVNVVENAECFASIGIVIALYIRCPGDKGVVQYPGDQLAAGGWVSVCSVFSIISSHNNIYLSTAQSGVLVLVTPVLKREDNKRVIQLTTIPPEITLPLLCSIRCIKMHNIYIMFEMQSIKK